MSCCGYFSLGWECSWKMMLILRERAVETFWGLKISELSTLPCPQLPWSLGLWRQAHGWDLELLISAPGSFASGSRSMQAPTALKFSVLISHGASALRPY